MNIGDNNKAGLVMLSKLYTAASSMTVKIPTPKEKRDKPTTRLYGEWLARSPRRKVRGWQRGSR